MQFLTTDTQLIFPGQQSVSQFFPSGGPVTFIQLRVSVIGGEPRVYKPAKIFPRPTYQVGRVMFLDEQYHCLQHHYIEVETMNFGFWAIASGQVYEKIQHYDDSIERRGTGNFQCFVGPNDDSGLQLPIPGIPRADTQYAKEPLTPLDDLVPDDFDQALCRVKVKKVKKVEVVVSTDWPVCENTVDNNGNAKINCPYDPNSTVDLSYYVEDTSSTGTGSVRYVGHEDNGFTRYFDPRKHGNGNWCCGYIVERFDYAGDVSIGVDVDLFGGM